MFADLFYWAFDQVDNAAGIVNDKVSELTSCQDAFYQIFVRAVVIQLFFALLLSLALSI